MKWEIVHLPAKLYNPLEVTTVDVLAAVIEPKIGNSLVRKLNQTCLLEHLRHVKRIRKRIVEGQIELSVVLCLFEDYEGHRTESFFRLSVNTSYVLSEQKLPSMPLQQKKNGKNSASFGQHHFIRLMTFQVVNAAVIVDPMSKQVIARSYDQTCLTPSPTHKTNKGHVCSDEKEATITCRNTDGNDLLGTQGVPVPNLASDNLEESCIGVSCLNPWGWTQIRSSQKSIGSNCSWHPMKHAAIVAIENAAARDMKLFPNSGSYISQTQTDEAMGISDDFPVKQQKAGILVNEVSGNCLSAEMVRPYLCTGFDIYLVWEPCSMCAMALVHQRIRRIFFAFPNPFAGALGSVFRLQGEKSLNHHYAVYRIVIPEGDLNKLKGEGSDP